jgi:hypothetical protein
VARINPQLFTLESFPEQQSWIGKLFGPLNQLTGDIVRAFRNQLTIEDNLYQEIKEIKYINQTANFPLRFTPKFGASPKGLMSIYIYNETDAVYSTSAPHVVWSYNGNQIVISDISGLVTDKKYTIRLLVIYG